MSGDAHDDAPPQPGPAAEARRPADPEPDPDLSAVVAYSLAQTVEARLRGIRNYTRLLRETQQRQ